MNDYDPSKKTESFEAKLSSRKRLKSASDAWSPKVTKLAWQTKHGCFATPPLRQCRDAAVSLACSSFAEVPPGNPRDVARVGSPHSFTRQVSTSRVFFVRPAKQKVAASERWQRNSCSFCVWNVFPMSNIFYFHINATLFATKFPFLLQPNRLKRRKSSASRAADIPGILDIPTATVCNLAARMFSTGFLQNVWNMSKLWKLQYSIWKLADSSTWSPFKAFCKIWNQESLQFKMMQSEALQHALLLAFVMLTIHWIFYSILYLVHATPPLL